LRKDSEKSPNKLKRKHKYFVCSLLASGYSPALCVQELKERYEIEVTEDNIRDNYLNGRKWKPLIAKLSDKFQSQILQHPLAQKYNRLNFLLEAINEAFRIRDIKVYYDKDGVELSRLQRNYPAIIANLIREARMEVEGDKPAVIIANDNRKSIMQSIHHHYEENKKEEDEGSKDDTNNRLKVVE